MSICYRIAYVKGRDNLAVNGTYFSFSYEETKAKEMTDLTSVHGLYKPEFLSDSEVHTTPRLKCMTNRTQFWDPLMLNRLSEKIRFLLQRA